MFAVPGVDEGVQNAVEGANTRGETKQGLEVGEEAECEEGEREARIGVEEGEGKVLGEGRRRGTSDEEVEEEGEVAKEKGRRTEAGEDAADDMEDDVRRVRGGG